MYTLFSKKPKFSDIVIHVLFIGFLAFICFSSYYMNPNTYITFVASFYSVLIMLKTIKVFTGKISIKDLLANKVWLYDELSYIFISIVMMALPTVIEWVRFHMLIGR